MGIDYIVDLDCAPKQALSVEAIVSLIKGRNQASAVVEMMRHRGDHRPVEEMTFTRVSGSSAQEEKVSVKSLLDQSAALDSWEHHCRGCKANQLRRAYGCYGSVSYPITRRAEEWLMSLLPAELKSAGGRFLRKAVADFNYTGGMFLEMRTQDRFFESRVPVKREWGSWPSGWSVTSDQILEMLFGLGPLQSSHCHVMSIILGLIDIGETEPAKPPPNEDSATEQLAAAVNAVALACQLGVGLLIDA